MTEANPPAAPAPRRLSASRNVSFLFVGQLVARLLALLFYVVLARLLGPARIGDFAVGTAFGSLLSIPLEPGLNLQLMREGARDAGRRQEYASQAFAYKLGLTPVALVVMVGLALLLGYRGDALWAIALVGGALVLSHFDEFAASALAACERLDDAAWLRVVNKVVTSLAAAGVALAGGTFAQVCGAYLAGALASALIAIVVVHVRHIGLRRSAAPVSSLWHKVRAGMPLALSGTLWMIALRLDQAMASLLGVPAADIGGYNNAVKLKEALILVPATVGVSFTPVLSRQLDDAVAMRRDFSRALHWGLGGTIPIAVGTCVVAGPVMQLLFGAEFAAYGVLMQILFVAFAGSGLIELCTALAVARRRYRLQAWASGSLLAVNAGLNLLLVPRLGIVGAAIATAAGTLVGALVLASEAWRAGLLGPVLMALGRSLVAALPMALVAWWLLPVHVLVAVAAAGAVYVPLYVAIGGLGPGGLTALRQRLSHGAVP